MVFRSKYIRSLGYVAVIGLTASCGIGSSTKEQPLLIPHSANIEFENPDFEQTKRDLLTNGYEFAGSYESSHGLDFCFSDIPTTLEYSAEDIAANSELSKYLRSHFSLVCERGDIISSVVLVDKGVVDGGPQHQIVGYIRCVNTLPDIPFPEESGQIVKL